MAPIMMISHNIDIHEIIFKLAFSFTPFVLFANALVNKVEASNAIIKILFFIVKVLYKCL